MRSKYRGYERTVRERPYHAENTCTRPITDVKEHRARFVVSWETRCEARVSFSLSFFALVRHRVLCSVLGCFNVERSIPLSFGNQSRKESARARVRTCCPSVSLCSLGHSSVDRASNVILERHGTIGNEYKRDEFAEECYVMRANLTSSFRAAHFWMQLTVWRPTPAAVVGRPVEI